MHGPGCLKAGRTAGLRLGEVHGAIDEDEGQA